MLATVSQKLVSLACANAFLVKVDAYDFHKWMTEIRIRFSLQWRRYPGIRDVQWYRDKFFGDLACIPVLPLRE